MAQRPVLSSEPFPMPPLAASCHNIGLLMPIYQPGSLEAMRANSANREKLEGEGWYTHLVIRYLVTSSNKGIFYNLDPISPQFRALFPKVGDTAPLGDKSPPGGMDPLGAVPPRGTHGYCTEMGWKA